MNLLDVLDEAHTSDDITALREFVLEFSSVLSQSQRAFVGDMITAKAWTLGLEELDDEPG